jgi:hypothetical protein
VRYPAAQRASVLFLVFLLFLCSMLEQAAITPLPSPILTGMLIRCQDLYLVSSRCKSFIFMWLRRAKP